MLSKLFYKLLVRRKLFKYLSIINVLFKLGQYTSTKEKGFFREVTSGGDVYFKTAENTYIF